MGGGILHLLTLLTVCDDKNESTILPSSPFRYPTQKEWERKEQLYLNVIDLLERGKHWEHAIPLTKELADVYERRVFNYRKLVSFEFI